MKWARLTLVVVGALVVTAFGIDAADTLRGENGTMLAQLIGQDARTCPEGMRSVSNVPTIACVDAYEAAPGSDCPVTIPAHMLDTERNLVADGCLPEATALREPWRFVTRDQAMHLCARAEKRLPTSAEWYALALSMAEQEKVCNTHSGTVARTGEFTECVSPHGSYDLVGNVWEWVSDDVINGTYQGHTLPESGYVAQVDAGGMATVVHESPQDLFGRDYFWTRTEGAYGMIRGGYYDSDSDAGIYAVHADTLPTTAAPGIGFRCVRDVI